MSFVEHSLWSRIQLAWEDHRRDGRGRRHRRRYRPNIRGGGSQVACLDLSAPETTAAAISEAGGEALALACDVTDEARTTAVADEITAAWGGAHILVVQRRPKRHGS